MVEKDSTVGEMSNENLLEFYANVHNSVRRMRDGAESKKKQIVIAERARNEILFRMRNPYE